MLIGFIRDITTLVTILILLVRMCEAGVLKPEVAAFILVPIIVVQVLARTSHKRRLSHTVRLTLSFGVPLLSAVTFLFLSSRGGVLDLISLLLSFLAATMLICTLYLMLFGLFK